MDIPTFINYKYLYRNLTRKLTTLKNDSSLYTPPYRPSEFFYKDPSYDKTPISTFYVTQ